MLKNCAWCGTEGSGICPDCAEEMKRLSALPTREALRAEMKQYVEKKKREAA